jgi:hypothetical protein
MGIVQPIQPQYASPVAPDRALYAEIVNYDEMFHRESASERPVLITEFDVTLSEDKERLNRVLMTKYEGDTLDVTPQCDCGALKGEYRIGIRCFACKTTVDHVTERALKPSLWLEVPAGVRAFINPHMWTILHQALGSGNSNVLDYLTNPYYKPANITPVLRKVMDLGIDRGLNNFVDKFDDIIRMLFEKRGIITAKNKFALWTFVQKHRQHMFCRYLPVPSKLTFITEMNAGVTYTDKTMTMALDAIRTINSIVTAVMPLSDRQKESRVVGAISLLASYYWTFAGDPTGNKYAIIRQHIVGGRPHFTARAVISSISEPHQHDELVIPWGVAVLLLKLHLTNLLLKRGMSPNEIHRLLHENVNKYHPLLDELFNELINEGDGLWATLGRNPSLARLSIQYFRIGRIRGMGGRQEEVVINTIGMSVLTLRGPNADFDRFISVASIRKGGRITSLIAGTFPKTHLATTWLETASVICGRKTEKINVMSYA